MQGSMSLKQLEKSSKYQQLLVKKCKENMKVIFSEPPDVHYICTISVVRT